MLSGFKRTASYGQPHYSCATCACAEQDQGRTPHFRRSNRKHFTIHIVLYWFVNTYIKLK